ncbi:MAG: PilN domain-containing protein [Alphaproteobacteria bacterium]
MTGYADIVAYFSRWIDTTAQAIVSFMSSLGARKTVQVIEEEGGSFVIQSDRAAPSGLPFERVQIADGKIAGAHPDSIVAMLDGSRAELKLRPGRVLFRPLELPQRATEFLAGVVRAQIDRLTPWTPNDAAFGWSTPAVAGADRIVVTVAATARAMVQPVVDALIAAGAEAVAVTAAPPDAAAITVLERHASGSLDVARVRRALVAVLIVTGLAAGVSLTVAGLAGMKLASEQEDLTRRIAERRVAIRLGREGGAAATPLRALERRKYQNPSSVIVLEALSQILPDHTYVTELRIEGDKLRLIGVTRDAPGLIRLIEQSANFTRATFFAPTTRGPSDPGERFHIEAQIEPVFAVRS